MATNNMKQNKDTRFFLYRKGELVVTEDGKTIQRLGRVQSEEPLELGSIKNPKNQDVIEVKWDIPRKDMGSGILQGLFGGK